MTFLAPVDRASPKKPNARGHARFKLGAANKKRRRARHETGAAP
jgi:hypothetical protein